jgi:hypothetical protein
MAGTESQGGEIAKLGDVISNPELRKSFANDPHGTLQNAGIDKDQIPSEVMDTLSGLTPDELAVLDRVRTSLHSAGASPHDALGMV